MTNLDGTGLLACRLDDLRGARSVDTLVLVTVRDRFIVSKRGKRLLTLEAG